MRCEYKDGMKVDYSGSLHITKGQDVNVYMKEGVIPANIRSELDRASANFSCEDIRKCANEVTATVGNRACIHE
ncbi:MAG: hypothetical protein CXR30_04960 [Geobacter sp.]|nr:MAG: hypothetical protein CXR30_04960 [Geobacter sp.]